MRYACRTGYHERCPGRWCTCPCHQEAAVSRDQNDGLGCQAWCLSCQMDQHDQCNDPTGCHLEEDDQGGPQGGEAIGTP